MCPNGKVQNNGASAGNLLKTIIQSLSQIIISTVGIELSPETFRKAKFNKIEAVGELRNLLSTLIFFVESGILNSDAFSLSKFDITAKLKNLNCPLDVVDNSSLDLILACGWLFATFDLIDVIVLNNLRNSPILSDDSLASWKKKRQSNRNTIHSATKSNENVIKQIMFYNGRLGHSLKLIDIASKEKTEWYYKLKLKLNKFKDHGVSETQRSFMMKSLIQSKDLELIKDFKIEIKNFFKLAECYIFWKTNEDIFWKWMDSIVSTNDKLHEQSLEFDNHSFINEDYTKDEKDLTFHVEDFDQYYNSACNNLLLKLNDLVIEENNEYK